MPVTVYDIGTDLSGSVTVVLNAFRRPVPGIHWTPGPAVLQGYSFVLPEKICPTLPSQKRALTLQEQQHLMAALRNSSELVYEF